jgi:uncharacterized protein YabE (DUF348 family)
MKGFNMSTRIKKAIFLVLIVGAALAVTGFVVNSQRHHNKKITVVYDENAGQADDAATKVVTAKGTETIQTLLKDNGYTIDKDIYAYSVNLNKRASDIAKVTITKKAKGMLIVGDQTQYYSTAKKTVGGMLAEKNITVGQNDIVTPSKSSAMNTTVKKVQVVRVTKSTVESEVTLPYETKVVSSEAVPQGTVKVLQSGNTGIQSVKTVVTRHNGVVVSEKEQSKDIKKVASDMKIQVNPADAKTTSQGLKTPETQPSTKKEAATTSSDENTSSSEKTQTVKENEKASSAVKADNQSKQSTENELNDKNTNSEEKTAGDAETQTTKVITEKASIPFETQPLNLIANEELKVGEKKITTAGVDGEKEVTKTVTYQNGKVIKEVVDKEVITKNPVTEVVSIGVEDPEKKSSETDASSKTANTDTDSQTNNSGTQTVSGSTTTTNNTPASASPSAGATASSATQTTTSGASATSTSATTTAKPAAAKAPVQKVAVKTTTPSNNSKLSSDGQAALKSGATSGHKTASLNTADYNLVCAVVAAEDNTSYTGALAVASCIMNRADAGNWGGTTPKAVITAKGQFSAYLNGDYKKYANGKAPSYVQDAVRDCMTYGLRNHSYTSFRAGYVSGSKKIGGNYYF